MLFMEIKDVGENYIGHTNTLCGENAQYFSVKAGDTWIKICRYHFLSHSYCVPSPFHSRYSTSVLSDSQCLQRHPDLARRYGPLTGITRPSLRATTGTLGLNDPS